MIYAIRDNSCNSRQKIILSEFQKVSEIVGYKNA